MWVFIACQCEDIRFTSLEFLWKQSPPMQIPDASLRPSLRARGGQGGPGAPSKSVGARQGGRGGWEWPPAGGSLAWSSSALALRPSLARGAAASLSPVGAVGAAIGGGGGGGGGGSGGGKSSGRPVPGRLARPAAGSPGRAGGRLDVRQV